MRPNIFKYATSELSQDAVLAWLIEWADPNFEAIDTRLHETGKFFIQKLFEKASDQKDSWNEKPEILSIHIEPQRFRIDLLVGLECADNVKRYILIEDKIFANAGNGQLDGYHKKLNSIGIPSNQILKIFLKTGFQPDWSVAQNAGFSEFTALDLDEVWRFGASIGVKNDVFSDFQARLDNLKDGFIKDREAFQNFEKLKISDWTYWHWRGFFTKNQALFSAGFGDVPVARENLLAFWFGHIDVKIPMLEHPAQPYIDVVWSDNRKAYISIRLNLKGQTGISKSVRDWIVNGIQEREVYKNSQPGRFKDARNTMLLMNLPLNMGFSVVELTEHLQLLQSELAKAKWEALND